MFNSVRINYCYLITMNVIYCFIDEYFFNLNNIIMRFISTRVHGYLDYIMGFALILAPWIFGFYQGGIASWVPIILGVSVILYSLFTDYELGASRSISMKTHLTIDLLGGFILAVSPWLFGFAEQVFWPHLIVGIAEMGAALMTKTVTEYDYQHQKAHTP